MMDVKEIMTLAINGAVDRGIISTANLAGKSIQFQLSDLSGVPIFTCKCLMRGFKACKIHELETVLASLGYQLTAVESKQ